MTVIYTADAGFLPDNQVLFFLYRFRKFLVLNILRYNCIDTQYFMTLEFKISSIVHICRCLYLHFNKMYIVT